MSFVLTLNQLYLYIQLFKLFYLLNWFLHSLNYPKNYAKSFKIKKFELLQFLIKLIKKLKLNIKIIQLYIIILKISIKIIISLW